MNHARTHLIPVLSGLALVAGLLGCEKRLSEEARAAEELAKSAESRVALLEKELAELKTTAGKAAETADAEAMKQLAADQQKALERQIAEAKRRAEAKKKEAQDLATTPKPKDTPKPVLVDVPLGTKLEVTLAKDLSTETVKAGDAWEGSLASDVVVNGTMVWKAGSPVSGVVAQSVPAGRLSSGNGGLGIKLTSVGGADVSTGTYLVVGDKRGERNAKIIGGAAALGALVGVLSDKKNKGDHALGGAAIGAAAGTAAAAATAETAIKMSAAKPVSFELAAAEKVALKR